jgi:hypothetical protein
MSRAKRSEQRAIQKCCLRCWGARLCLLRVMQYFSASSEDEWRGGMPISARDDRRGSIVLFTDRARTREQLTRTIQRGAAVG